MNESKQHTKLLKLQSKAQECLSREEAQELIRKSDKAHNKLNSWNTSCGISPYNL